MSITVTGRIHFIDETNHVSDRFTKREFVLEIEDGKYPQMVLFQCTGDRCDNLNSYRAGDEVALEVNLCGRAWDGHSDGKTRYFNSLEVWRMKKVGESANVPPPPADDYGPPPDMDADIPF